MLVVSQNLHQSRQVQGLLCGERHVRRHLTASGTEHRKRHMLILNLHLCMWQAIHMYETPFINHRESEADVEGLQSNWFHVHLRPADCQRKWPLIQAVLRDNHIDDRDLEAWTGFPHSSHVCHYGWTAFDRENTRKRQGERQCGGNPKIFIHDDTICSCSCSISSNRNAQLPCWVVTLVGIIIYHSFVKTVLHIKFINTCRNIIHVTR
jgi:hypothetical protein